MRWIVGVAAVVVVVVACGGSELQEVAVPAPVVAEATTNEVSTSTAATSDAEAEAPGDDDLANATDEPAIDTPAATSDEASNDGLFPTVVNATASTSNGTTWRFDVTLLSEYDSPERYADAWRVLDGNDNELGIRVLGHDHAGEQPFTRSTSVEIPTDVDTVYIEARDQLNGWNDERFEVVLER